MTSICNLMFSFVHTMPLIYAVWRSVCNEVTGRNSAIMLWKATLDQLMEQCTLILCWRPDLGLFSRDMKQRQMMRSLYSLSKKPHTFAMFIRAIMI
jgi:hypothetical protein